MKRQYTFDCNHDSDLIFKYGGKSHNLGYNSCYNATPFILIWLYHLQIKHENLFRAVPFITGEDRKLESPLSDKLEGAIEFSRSLPVDVSEFNLETQTIGLRRHTSGLCNQVYNWQLEDDGLLHLSFQEKSLVTKKLDEVSQQVFALSVKRGVPFLKDYLAFLESCPHMGACYDYCSTVIHNLQRQV